MYRMDATRLRGGCEGYCGALRTAQSVTRYRFWDQSQGVGRSRQKMQRVEEFHGGKLQSTRLEMVPEAASQ